MYKLMQYDAELGAFETYRQLREYIYYDCLCEGCRLDAKYMYIEDNAEEMLKLACCEGLSIKYGDEE